MDYFTISVGQELGSSSGGWLWLRVSHEVIQCVDWNYRQLKTQTGVRGYMSKLMHMFIGRLWFSTGSFPVCPSVLCCIWVCLPPNPLLVR